MKANYVRSNIFRENGDRSFRTFKKNVADFAFYSSTFVNKMHRTKCFRTVALVL